MTPLCSGSYKSCIPYVFMQFHCAPETVQRNYPSNSTSTFRMFSLLYALPDFHSPTRCLSVFFSPPCSLSPHLLVCHFIYFSSSSVAMLLTLIYLSLSLSLSLARSPSIPVA